MIKEAVLLLGLTVFAFSASGCSTICQASKGAAKGAVSGAKQDIEAIKKADSAIRKDYW